MSKSDAYVIQYTPVNTDAWLDRYLSEFDKQAVAVGVMQRCADDHPEYQWRVVRRTYTDEVVFTQHGG